MISLARNRLLAALPEQDFERLTVGLGSVHLCLGDILYHAGEEIRHVYFPEQGLISLVATMMDGATVETGIVGNEGMMGVPVLLGASSAPYRAIVQVEGQAWRMRADAFKYEMLGGGALRKRLLLYTQALMTQMSQMAACNCLHTVEERLCSLLLMIDDRMDSNEFFLTHEMIAEMLGARLTEAGSSWYFPSLVCSRRLSVRRTSSTGLVDGSKFGEALTTPSVAGNTVGSFTDMSNFL